MGCPWCTDMPFPLPLGLGAQGDAAVPYVSVLRSLGFFGNMTGSVLPVKQQPVLGAHPGLEMSAPLGNHRL